MDDRLHELVSRYLDDDLTDAETSEVSRLIEEDAEFAAEVETSKALRSAVGQLASRMEPPRALDAVMKPLRTSPPVSTRRVRPAFRWLGIAAAVVLGTTVALEMARRHPGPTPEAGGAAHPRPIQSESEIFELAPLPTANPAEERPLGAADRLLAEDPPVPAPPDPRPLEVMGPLPGVEPKSEPESASSSIAAPPAGKGRAAEDSAVSSRARRSATSPSPQVATAGKRDAAPTTITDKSTASTGSTRAMAKTVGVAAGGPEKNHDAGRIHAAPVILVIDETEVWWGKAYSCVTPTTRVRIEIRDGVVIAVNPLPGEAGTDDATPCRPEGLVGAAVEEVDDGMHTAEIVLGRH